MEKYMAYYAGDCEMETFKTQKEAEEWLKSYQEDDITEESMNGGDFIAKITHRSKWTVTDKKSNYSQEEIEDSEWPWDYDESGIISMDSLED